MAKNGKEITPWSPEDASKLQWVDNVTDLLDSRFRIPGTKIQFGADFILGLIPGIGDALSLGVSGTIIATMARHGASPLLVLRMLINVGIDAVFGSIPVIGNLFDLFFKANTRNMNLMREYYEADKHRGSPWPLLIAILIFFMVLLAGLGFTIYVLVSWITSLFAG